MEPTDREKINGLLDAVLEQEAEWAKEDKAERDRRQVERRYYFDEIRKLAPADPEG